MLYQLWFWRHKYQLIEDWNIIGGVVCTLVIMDTWNVTNSGSWCGWSWSWCLSWISGNDRSCLLILLSSGINWWIHWWSLPWWLGAPSQLLHSVFGDFLAWRQWDHDHLAQLLDSGPIYCCFVFPKWLQMCLVIRMIEHNFWTDLKVL